MHASPHAVADWARAAAAEPGSVLLKTARPDAENRKSYLFSGPLEVLSARRLDEIPRVFAGIERALAAGRFVAGFLSYEAGSHFEPAARRGLPDFELASGDLPLAWFGVYDAPLIADDLDGAAARTADTEAACGEPSIGVSRAEYAQKIQQIRGLIERGDLYQANFTVPLWLTWAADAAQLFDRLMANQPVAYGALVNMGAAQIVSASPELFFRREGRRIVVRPMKGTCPRGRDLEEDARNAAWLASDEKNRAENVMIVDLLRNDLGRICAAGSVRVTDLFRVERYSGLLQMTSTVEGELLDGATQYEIFRSLFPCGSITGAPKIRTMQVIAGLEGGPRGIACGAIGFFAPGGDAVFSVAIRTVMLRAGVAELRVGSGITYDSDADAEYDECLLKSRFLTRAPLHFDLIETMLWDSGYFLLDLHLDRLAESAAYFDFRFDAEPARAELCAFAVRFAAGTRHRVRVLLARLGVLSLASERLGESGRTATLMIAAERTDAADPFLRHKATHRALYDRVFAEARAGGFDDALFLNQAGEVTEGAIHNVMIARDGELLTPALDCGVLPGVYRRRMLQTHPKLREAVLTIEDLEAADHVYIFNSVRGLRRVRRIEGCKVHGS
jgi:para-aminobenzoate synthetase/4-amino-4-deoxychorismate lyase